MLQVDWAATEKAEIEWLKQSHASSLRHATCKLCNTKTMCASMGKQGSFCHRCFGHMTKAGALKSSLTKRAKKDVRLKEIIAAFLEECLQETSGDYMALAKLIKARIIKPEWVLYILALSRCYHCTTDELIDTLRAWGGEYMSTYEMLDVMGAKPGPVAYAWGGFPFMIDTSV